jgi:hypothetical protein
VEHVSGAGQPFASGDKAKEIIGLSHYTLKEHAKTGVLVEGVHFFRMGRCTNARYYWLIEPCIKHYRSRQLASRQGKPT